MKIQESLRSGEWTLNDLSEKLGIRIGRHESEDLVVLNYDQIESPKHHPVAKECRGLVLESGTWDVVARSFGRFFNYGECREIENKFDWNNFVAEEKCDGSLMLLFNYRDSWRINTRGSFGNGEIVTGCGLTWREGFYRAVKNRNAVDGLPSTHTFVFEFCSRWNKVVRDYPEPVLFLLSAFHNKSGSEASEILCDRWAEQLGVLRPQRYDVKDISDLIGMINNHPEATFEGCVIRDRNGARIKVKNPRYVALHHLKDNGNLYLVKNIVPLVMKGEAAEVLVHFPEAADKVFEVVEQLGGLKSRLLAVWDAARNIESQKEFAAYVNRHCPKLSGMLFAARKHQKTIDQVWQEGEISLVKLLDKPN